MPVQIQKVHILGSYGYSTLCGRIKIEGLEAGASRRAVRIDNDKGGLPAVVKGITGDYCRRCAATARRLV